MALLAPKTLKLFANFKFGGGRRCGTGFKFELCLTVFTKDPVILRIETSNMLSFVEMQ